jgi:O-acetyl-ADP-ribose deacetylase (regulator of RNase III)
MKYIKKDLIQAVLDNDIDVIGHGCNCFCTMGKGIAKSIKETFPFMYKLDCMTEKGDRSKLGTINYSDFSRKDNSRFFVVNCYTQFTYWNVNDMLDYNAIDLCMKEINNRFETMRIGLPKIGAGLARGNWNIIENIIENNLNNITIYYL